MARIGPSASRERAHRPLVCIFIALASYASLLNVSIVNSSSVQLHNTHKSATLTTETNTPTPPPPPTTTTLLQTQTQTTTINNSHNKTNENDKPQQTTESFDPPPPPPPPSPSLNEQPPNTRMDLTKYIIYEFNTRNLSNELADFDSFADETRRDVFGPNPISEQVLDANSLPAPSSSSAVTTAVASSVAPTLAPNHTVALHPRPYYGDAFFSFQQVYWPIHCVICIIICTIGIFANLTNVVVLTSYNWALYILIHAHLTVTSHTISIWLTCVLATWRYCVLRSTNKLSNWPTALAIRTIACVFLFVPLFCIPNYLSFDIVAEQTETNSTIYKVGFSYLAEKSQFIKTFHFWIFSCLTKLLPCVLLTFFTTVLIRKLLSAREHRLRLTSSLNDHKLNTMQITNGNDAQHATTKFDNNNNNNNNVKATIEKTGKSSKRKTTLIANKLHVRKSNSKHVEQNKRQAKLHRDQNDNELLVANETLVSGQPNVLANNEQHLVVASDNNDAQQHQANDTSGKNLVIINKAHCEHQQHDLHLTTSSPRQASNRDTTPHSISSCATCVDCIPCNASSGTSQSDACSAPEQKQGVHENKNTPAVSVNNCDQHLHTTAGLLRTIVVPQNVVSTSSTRSASTCGALESYATISDDAKHRADATSGSSDNKSLVRQQTSRLHLLTNSHGECNQIAQAQQRTIFAENGTTNSELNLIAKSSNLADGDQRPSNRKGSALELTSSERTNAAARGRSMGSASFASFHVVKFHAAQRQLSQNETTTRLLIAVIIVFLICEFPAGILAALCAILGQDFFDNVYQPMGILTDLLALINSTVNFALYCLMSTQFRVTFYRVVLHCPAPQNVPHAKQSQFNLQDR